MLETLKNVQLYDKPQEAMACRKQVILEFVTN